MGDLGAQAGDDDLAALVQSEGLGWLTAQLEALAHWRSALMAQDPPDIETLIMLNRHMRWLSAQIQRLATSAPAVLAAAGGVAERL